MNQSTKNMFKYKNMNPKQYFQHMQQQKNNYYKNLIQEQIKYQKVLIIQIQNIEDEYNSICNINSNSNSNSNSKKRKINDDDCDNLQNLYTTINTESQNLSIDIEWNKKLLILEQKKEYKKQTLHDQTRNKNFIKQNFP
jgi:hypothetical protein